MAGEITWESKSAFAARQGWRPSYVTKLKDQQRLVLSHDGRLVNVEATLELLKRTSDPEKDGIRAHHAAGRVEKNVTAKTRPDSSDDDSGGGYSSNPQYWEAKARRESSLAELAELELEKKRGNLVERDRVEAAAYASNRVLRDSALGLATKLAPELATMTDPFMIETRLREALRGVFSDAAKMTADDLAKAMEPPH